MPLDVLGRTRATLTEPASTPLAGRPGKRKSSACVDYVPALCTHRPSLLPIEWLSEASGLAQRGRQRPLRAGKLSKLGHLEENSVNHRIFERTLRPPVFWRACLFERHFNHQAPGLVLTSDQVGRPAELKHINKRRKRNQQGLP
ncbi:hypothetical protein F5144DRAFT_595794 [Chaetomium tenue]|uniref:Uncharacterized protein n=2 Tax=Chaetomium tenue TaxID=1854479 RepID=A0ACB7P4U2_9PEZI|nr:hypothetical protein F5144DRAFT_495304 [Chaetomium globosum]KAH6623668.1 hypothetical protein F5144DRAFT_595794 [Chaetomium globosum]